MSERRELRLSKLDCMFPNLDPTLIRIIAGEIDPITDLAELEDALRTLDEEAADARAFAVPDPTMDDATSSLESDIPQNSSSRRKRKAPTNWVKANDLVPTYKPVTLEEQKKTSVQPSTATPKYPADLNNVAHAIQESSEKAAEAYRRANSKNHFGAVAGAYSADARALLEKYQQGLAKAADAQVAESETRTSIDLHGVDRKNSIRIAAEKVQAWWSGLGEGGTRIARTKRIAVGGGFHIVVGVGKHSSGGKAVVGPSVNKSLEEAGWLTEWERSGCLVVKGRAF
jgi:hypothetical protein